MNRYKIFLFLICTSFILGSGCKNEKKSEDGAEKGFSGYLQDYYEARLVLFPFDAMQNGDNRYNDQLPIDISVSHREKLRAFYNDHLEKLKSFDREKLSPDEQLSYDVMQWEMNIGLEGLVFPDHLIPINQFWSFPSSFARYGSGKSSQPFNTVKDYENFLTRAALFPAWCDTAVANMRMGISQGITLPKVLAAKVTPQMRDIVSEDIRKSIFYMPVLNFPADFSAADKSRLDSLYTMMITTQVNPAYDRLYKFFKDEYTQKCRENIGITEVPGGSDYYAYLVKYWTTTEMTPDSIFNLGMSEVKRIKSEMEQIKNETGYKGDLKSFFKFVNTDKQFFPFETPEEVVDSFYKIHEKMKPQLSKLFDQTPKSKFEVRRTEKFREASASAEYSAGTPDGSRPGIFYTPIPDAKKYTTFAMEDLFLHEAIPGHHYQNMLTAENENLPMFRRFIWYGAYGEGWALYTESLGKELGLYEDPYQYLAALSAEMHRAIRLVVDVGMHTKGWTREQAIEFSLENEGESEESITSEVERYIAIPAQALSYKIGQLKIRALRSSAEMKLGDKFDIRKFHNEVLNGGCLPIAVLEKKLGNGH